MVFVGAQMFFWGAVCYKRAVLENVAQCIVENAQMWESWVMHSFSASEAQESGKRK